MNIRVNVGCGDTPTEGWVNFDNSPSVRYPPWLLSAMRAVGLASAQQVIFARKAKALGVRYADATGHIPSADGSVDVVYSCHMVEHLYPARARAFLREARRVLKPGGILRLVLPDLAMLAGKYVEDRDADAFMSRSLLSSPEPVSLLQKVNKAIVGDRHHLWLYDAASLSKLVVECGFSKPSSLRPGDTTIPNPGSLDLFQRAEESVCIEAIRP